jgi:hypothetical protein
MAKGIKTGGRSSGTPNKATQEFKEALNDLLNHAAPHMIVWLDRIAKDDPAKAMDIISKYIEFVYPKLARAEHQPLGSDGKPTDWNITVNIPDADKN